AYEEGVKVTSTTFDPHAGMPDIPTNHVELTYEVQTIEAGTLLTITQGDFAQATDGEKRYLESKGGWKEVVVPLMKKVLGE
ncbi:MAG: hypothetical protein AB8G22_28715, partial [Saprospiraceae bacterium]